MPFSGAPPVRIAAAVAACAGLAYAALAIARVRRFRARRDGLRDGDTRELPRVTVFKPLHGGEPHLYENLRSFCDQDYPDFQIVFCIADASDLAADVARRLQREFPWRRIEITAGNPARAANPKIANVLGGYGLADGEILAIADSDIVVDRGYLRAIAAPFSEPGTGAVTCLYGAIPNDTPWSRLGAMNLTDAFAPSVLVAEAVEGLSYCFGATMAVRRDVLERAGGLQSIADRLGDDYELGRLVTRAGYRVELSPYIVRTRVCEPSLTALFLHELRWARTVRSARPAGYAGSVMTHFSVLAATLALLAPSAFSAAVFCLAAAARLTLHRECSRTFAGRPEPALLPLRDVISAAVWLAGLVPGRVRWQTGLYGVGAGGRLTSSGTDL